MKELALLSCISLLIPGSGWSGSEPRTAGEEDWCSAGWDQFPEEGPWGGVLSLPLSPHYLHLFSSSLSLWFYFNWHICLISADLIWLFVAILDFDDFDWTVSQFLRLQNHSMNSKDRIWSDTVLYQTIIFTWKLFLLFLFLCVGDEGAAGAADGPTGSCGSGCV